jgi:small subunit ribosomal protein S18
METTKEKKFFTRKKVCKFCTETAEIDYKNTDLLSQFITERKKILPRRTTGLCAYHQRELTSAIKRARVMALLPFTVLH